MRRSAIDKWLSESEGLPFPASRADIESLQLERLNEPLELCRRSSFYKNRLPSHVGSLEEIASLPFTTPADISRSPGAFLSVSQGEVARIITDETSGTASGSKRVFYTEQDLERTAGFFACGLSELISKGDRALICMPSQKYGSVGELISRAIASLGAHGYILGVGRTFTEWLRETRNHNINRIVAMPVPLLSFARYAKAEGAKLDIPAALVSADSCSQAILGAISSELGCELFPHYGSRESGLGGAITCPAHEGMHLRENDLLCEIVDESGAPLPDGESGELVITTLTRRAMPLVRYRTGDTTFIYPERCRCGSAVKRIAPVSRSSAQSVDIAALDDVLFSCEDILDYSAAVRAGALELCVTTVSGSGDGIAELARPLAGGLEVTVSPSRYDSATAPAFIHKRFIRTEGV